MTGVLLAVAVVNALVVGLVAWAMSRRYGAGRAMLVPLIAMLAAGFMVWRSVSVDGHDPMGVVASAFLIAGPWVLGAFLGLAVARWQGR
jgi:methionine-rich copper-binding protein CopC